MIHRNGPLVLRPWQEGDEASLARHADDREVWRNMRDRFPHPYTLADAEAWVRTAGSADPVTNFALVVDREAAGGIGLMLHDDVERVSAEIGYWLGREFWGRGIATEAVRALTAYGFETFRLTRIFAVPYAYNTASCRVLEKAGYVLEGRMRRSALKDGAVTDQLMYAVTDEDRSGSAHGG